MFSDILIHPNGKTLCLLRDQIPQIYHLHIPQSPDITSSQSSQTPLYSDPCSLFPSRNGVVKDHIFHFCEFDLICHTCTDLLEILSKFLATHSHFFRCIHVYLLPHRLPHHLNSTPSKYWSFELSSAVRDEADLFPAPSGPMGYTDPALSMSTAPPSKAKQGSVHTINCEFYF